MFWGGAHNMALPSSLVYRPLWEITHGPREKNSSTIRVCTLGSGFRDECGMVLARCRIPGVALRSTKPASPRVAHTRRIHREPLFSTRRYYA